MQRFRRSSGELGRLYLMAFVVSVTGWHLLSQGSQGVETEGTGEDVDALMKSMGKGTSYGDAKEWLSSSEGPAEIGVMH